MTKPLQLVVCLLLVGCCDISAQILGIDIYAFMRDAETITLFAVESASGADSDAKTHASAAGPFRGYVVIREIALTEEGEREKVRKAITDAFTYFPDQPYECFEPRYAVRLVCSGRTLDVLLSYECRVSGFYLGSQSMQAPLGPRGEKELVDVLCAHGFKETDRRKMERAEPGATDNPDSPSHESDEPSEFGPPSPGV